MFVKEKAAGEVKELSNAARVCLEAATLLEARGICYGTFSRGLQVCTGHALGLAVANLNLSPELFYGIDRAFVAVVGNTVVGWNDSTRPRTAKAVATLRHIATLV